MGPIRWTYFTLHSIKCPSVFYLHSVGIIHAGAVRVYEAGEVSVIAGSSYADAADLIEWLTRFSDISLPDLVEFVENLVTKHTKFSEFWDKI